jgi:uncharacterized membrane protein
MAQNIFKGLGVALITPFNTDGSVDYQSLKRLVEFQIDNGADFLCILATTGEAPCLTQEEKDKITELVKDVNKGRIKILKYCGGNNTAAVVEEIKNTDWSGIDDILSICPYYNKPSQEGLYDKYLMAPPENGGVGLDRMIVQSWYNIYQCFLMGAMLLMIWWPTKKNSTPFHWHWSIIFISIFLSAADFVYFYALSLPGAMISIVSMIRRGSVIVSFLFGAAIFHEKNLKAKFVDLLLVLLGMLFLYFGTK